MKSYLEGQVVRGGVYFSRVRGDFVSVGRSGGRLPEGGRFVRIPTLLLLLLGPALGLLFVIFLPVLGPVMLLGFGAYRAGQRLRAPSARPVAVVASGEDHRDAGSEQ